MSSLWKLMTSLDTNSGDLDTGSCLWYNADLVTAFLTINRFQLVGATWYNFAVVIWILGNLELDTADCDFLGQALACRDVFLYWSFEAPGSFCGKLSGRLKSFVRLDEILQLCWDSISGCLGSWPQPRADLRVLGLVPRPRDDFSVQ